MGMKRRLAGALFGGVIEEIVKERLQAAAVTDDDETGWRKLSGDQSRNLSPLKQDRMIQIAFWLWENNPLGNWIIETTVALILAEGLPYESKNEKVKEALDDFWYDPLNRMDLFLEKYVRELFMYGELCLPRFRAEQTGKVRLGYIDPANIQTVVTDPENVKMVIGVVVRGAFGGKPRKYRTVLPKDAEEILSSQARDMRARYTDGECHFFAINNVTNSPRGRSELLVVADWLDAYEQFLFDYADKWPLLNAFVWDLEVEGGTPEQIKDHISKFTKKPGSVYGHNEKVKLEASTPDLKSVDAEKGARLFRNHILGAKCFPEHWFGGAGDVNRATAAEAGTPTYKTLSFKQRYVKFILETIFEDVIESRREAQYLKVSDGEAGDYSVTTPELAAQDVTKYSAVVRDLAVALVSAQEQGWIDEKTARTVFAGTLAYLGVEVDADEIEKATEEAKKKEGYEDYGD